MSDQITDFTLHLFSAFTAFQIPSMSIICLILALLLNLHLIHINDSTKTNTNSSNIAQWFLINSTRTCFYCFAIIYFIFLYYMSPTFSELFYGSLHIYKVYVFLLLERSRSLKALVLHSHLFLFIKSKEFFHNRNLHIFRHDLK